MKSNLQKVHAHLIGAIFDLKDLILCDNIQYRSTAVELTNYFDMLSKQIKAIEEKL